MEQEASKIAPLAKLSPEVMRLRTAGESLGVALSDHIVLGHERYHSSRAAEVWDRG